MPQFIAAKNSKELLELLKVHEAKNRVIYLYFYGQKDDNGVSWCPDCTAAEAPIMHAFNNYALPSSVVFTVDVGTRSEWKDKDNSFRHPPFSVNSIPTLVRWKGTERIDGSRVLKDSILRMFFDEVKQMSSAVSSRSRT